MLNFLIAAALLPQKSPNLVIDPLLLVEANEIWSVIGQPNNTVWPGWDARKTPILIYFPGKQDVLINHPNPPGGFVKYTGEIKSPIGIIYVRDNETVMTFDGQNTSTKVGGVETLVIADTLSTRRQWLLGLASTVVSNPETAEKTIERSLFGTPFSMMTMFAHEAFHVYQEKLAPKKGGKNEALTQYPSLSVDNNVGYTLESDYLANALKVPANQVRNEAIKWLAVRDWRRKGLSKASIEFEEATEFSEGLAKYVEYKTLQSLEGHKPNPSMWLVQGFTGYSNLTPERDGLVRSMQGFMSGANLVNNDPYGASGIRFRLYYSGMALGVILDRLGAKWHDRALKTDISLTELVREALKPTAKELEDALGEIKNGSRFASLQVEKQKLATDGEAHIQSELAKFGSAPGELVIDYSQVKEPKVGFSFTPFGILRVDEERNIMRLIPIRGLIGDLTFSESSSRPVMHDTKKKLIHFQLIGEVTEASLQSLLGGGFSVDGKDVELPGVSLKKVKGVFSVTGKRVTLRVE